MTNIPITLFLGIVFNLPVGIIAYKKKSLTYPRGIIVAALIGYSIFIAHHILWGLLFIFFATSSILTKFKENSEIKVQAMMYAEKGGERDGIQVLANGGTALIGAVFLLFTLGFAVNDLLSPLFLFIAVSLAATTSDTWSTEIGTTSKSDPVWIFNLKKRVPRGTSGGVSFKGTSASFFGSLIIAIFYTIFALLFGVWKYNDLERNHLLFVALLTIGGFLGSIIDSILGATIQAVFKCPKCNKITEKTKHPKCGLVETEHISGIKWLNNDGVNFLSAFLASILMIIVYILLI